MSRKDSHATVHRLAIMATLALPGPGVMLAVARSTVGMARRQERRDENDDPDPLCTSA